MPAGLPYFAWINAGETTFGPEHLRWDEQVFSFTLKQEEGDPASLTIAVRRPRNMSGDPIGLLGPGRKIWAWFAFDCGPALIKFRGRLVGIPTSLFEDLVTLEFVAKPIDLVAQKQALAESLKVLPFYDEAVIDPRRRGDPDVVLEGYTKIWHYNPETHVLTVSDEIVGEDGTVEFDGISENGKVLYDGLGLSLTSGPLTRVDLEAEYTWTQQARGTVDLTGYLIGGWPGAFNGAIQLNAGDWPKPGTGIGDGWEVADSSAQDLHNYSVKTETRNSEFTIKFSEDDVAKATITESISYLGAIVEFSMADPNWVITNENYSSTFGAGGEPPSMSHSFSASRPAIAVQEIKPSLVAGYNAERQCTERVSLSLIADVQPILTDPEDGQALRIDDIRSVNLSEPGEFLIGDARRRSYIATERGNRSLEHLIAFARAHLMKRSRVVEITFVPKLSRMPEVTLRKNATLSEPRVGVALGKIISYSIALDGNDGRIACEVRIGCPIGRGGSAVAAEGLPTYCSIDYTGPDYQQFNNRVVLINAFLDSSVGYYPPSADPNDDDINFLSGLTWRDVIESGLVVVRGPAALEDQQPPTNSGGVGGSTEPGNIEQLLEARQEWMKNIYLPQYETRATFKLKSMTREFATDYVLQVTDLKIPTGYNLEAT